ncbi:MAG: iron chelate uptake ABC transporter family permease subunit [Geminicoccaceae bacterium]
MFQPRPPRVILGMLVGAGLATVGTMLQAVTRTLWPTPYLFGVSAGASAGAVLVIVHTGEVLGSLTCCSPPSPARCSLLGVMAVALGTGGLARDRLVLAGVAVSFVLDGAHQLPDLPGRSAPRNSACLELLAGLAWRAGACCCRPPSSSWAAS